MGVTLRGKERVRKALLRMSGEGEKAARREIKRAALNVEAGAKRLAPVDTGRLRSSITHETRDNGLSAVVGTNVEYAEHVEHGTRRQRAQPYLFPAFEQAWPDFVARLRRELGADVI